ncbi:putative RNA methyltransferase [Nocardia sp. NPDC127526]|uniref:putative RNA methyltransferase n=1 Tax=Nocardia sp. NPDC127526 TaxID=3345393 RepID=UPI0036260FC4
MSHTPPFDRLTGTTVKTESPPAERLIACADLLSCPECGNDISVTDRTLRCPRGHSFDIAKQGYVSLLTGASTKMTGDTPAMLDARAAFQAAGHFTPIATALSQTVAALPAPALRTAAPEPTSRPANTAVPSPSGSRITRPGSTAAAAAAARLSATLLAGPGRTSHSARESPRHPGALLGRDPQRPPTRAVDSGHKHAGMTEDDPGPAAEIAHNEADGGAPGPGGKAMLPNAGAAVLEIGAGTGYYLAAVLDALPAARGIALDVSKPAAKRSARAHPRAGAVLADAWRGLPIRDGVMSAALCVFAPRNADEVARVLNADGRFIVVTPTSRHLGELIEPLGMVRVDSGKDERLADSLGERFELLDRQAVEYTMALTHADIANVAGMGPSAHHAAVERAGRIAALPDPLAVTASVTIATYRVRRAS